MESQSIGFISLAVTLGLFVFSHVCITIWWASRVNTLLSVVQSELKEIVDEFKSTRFIFSTKDEVSRALAISDKEHQAIWKRIDEIRNDLSKGGAK